MHLNPIYSSQSIAGENFIFIKNETQLDMTRVISLSDSAAWLWTQLEKKYFTINDVLELLVEHYEVEEKTASSDIQKWLEQLKQNDLLLD